MSLRLGKTHDSMMIRERRRFPSDEEKKIHLTRSHQYGGALRNQILPAMLICGRQQPYIVVIFDIRS